jgi:hypothetical protein
LRIWVVQTPWCCSPLSALPKGRMSSW